MLNFVLAMIQNPEVLKKAQAEIDAVIGRDHPPSFKDLDNLPYIRAIVKETLRWRPVGPLGKHPSQPGHDYIRLKSSPPGLPHAVTEVVRHSK
jgi:cytochrome P450